MLDSKRRELKLIEWRRVRRIAGMSVILGAILLATDANTEVPGAAGPPYPDMPKIAPIGVRIARYMDVPESAKGPAIDPARGYRIQALGKGLYMITDNAYQSMFMEYESGVVVIDAPPSFAAHIRQAIAEVTPKPITHLVYSHSHIDHIGGARGLGGHPLIIAHEETRRLLARANDPDRPLPSVTFRNRYTLKAGSQVLELSYHGNAHEPGNIFIEAPAQKTLMVVDVIAPGWMPWRRLSLAEDIPGYFAQPLSATTVTASGSTLKLTFTAINGTYEGKLSPDGKIIEGIWTQGAPLPLTLTLATRETTWTIPEPPPPPRMMDTAAKPEFEVATIKPSDPSRPGFGININQSGIFTTRNTTLADLVKFAFQMHPRQVIGAPAWFDSDKFDISGKPDKPGIPNVTQMHMMVQGLLTDRFSLTFTEEKRDLTAYVITVAKGGLKIHEAESSPVPVPGFGGPPRLGFNVRNATMPEFASILQAQFLDQPAVDKTGLGNTRYTFVMKFTPDPGTGPMSPPVGTPPPADDAEAPPDLFAAMEQQLGLHIQKTRVPVPVMVIKKVGKAVRKLNPTQQCRAEIIACFRDVLSRIAEYPVSKLENFHGIAGLRSPDRPVLIPPLSVAQAVRSQRGSSRA